MGTHSTLFVFFFLDGSPLFKELMTSPKSEFFIKEPTHFKNVLSYRVTHMNLDRLT